MMTNEELKVLSEVCNDLAVIRQEWNKCRKELAYKSSVNERQDKDYETLRELYETACADRKAFREKAEALEAERDDARRKLGALCRTVNHIVGWDKAKQLRVFMRDYEAAVKKCINENHIVMTEGGMAK